jgi:hypothetical protein
MSPLEACISFGNVCPWFDESPSCVVKSFFTLSCLNKQRAPSEYIGIICILCFVKTVRNTLILFCHFFAFLACYSVDPSYETIHDSGPSENRFDLIFIGDRYFEDEMDKYADQIDKVWLELQELHGFWGRYQNFFNVHRIDLVSLLGNPEDLRDVSNSALGINLRANKPFFLSKDSSAVNSVIKTLGLAADTRFIVMGREYGSGWGWFNADLAYGPANSSLIAHEFGHSLVGLRDEYWTWITSTGGVPNMAKSHEEAENKWGYWYGYVDPDTGLAVGKLLDGKWVPHMDKGDDYYRPSPNSTLMRGHGVNQHFDAVARELLILDLYKHVRPLDHFTDNSTAVRKNQLLEVGVVDPEIIELQWSVDGVVVGFGPRLDLSSVRIENGELVTLLAYDSTLNTDYLQDDRGGWVRRDPSNRLSQTVTWEVIVPEIEDEDGDGLPDSWEKLHGITSPLATSDNDGDGYSDFYEYAFALDPQRGNYKGGGSFDSEERYLNITFNRHVDSAHLKYVLQRNTSLMNHSWVDVLDAKASSSLIDSLTEKITFKIPIGTEEMIFYRVHVSN